MSGRTEMLKLGQYHADMIQYAAGNCKKLVTLDLAFSFDYGEETDTRDLRALCTKCVHLKKIKLNARVSLLCCCCLCCFCCCCWCCCFCCCRCCCRCYYCCYCCCCYCCCSSIMFSHSGHKISRCWIV